MTHEPKFLRRFEQLRTALRRHQWRVGWASTILAAALGLGLMTWADYSYELPRSTRAGGLVLAVVATAVVCWRGLVEPLRWWTRPRTAFEIESRFPELGQRIRTVIQYAGRDDQVISSEGVKPSLVEALGQETDERSDALPLDRVVRRRRAQVLAVVAAVPVALLVFAGVAGEEWRIALERSLLIERPYSTVEVNPGDAQINRGEDLPLVITISGRPRRSVAIQTRPAGKADGVWRTEPLDPLAKGPNPMLDARLEKLMDSIEYRVVAGPTESRRYEVRVRHPLTIEAFEVEVKPPAYTGLEPKTTQGGDARAVEGSVATIKIAFDAPPVEASLEVIDRPARPLEKGQPAPNLTRVPLKAEGKNHVARLDLAKDLEYKVVAKTADGRFLPKNKNRIDVREDRAPRVVFDEPDEALEVHPIAEVRHRARVDDDFGLARAGIVFRFNDGEEKTLVSREFPKLEGKKPQISATLEEDLLLETLEASPLDSVTYYAFAEDNFPGGSRRTETDLRYIDLRAFRREYKLAEPGSGDGDPLDFIALDELIARQRVNLNRATRLARHKPADRIAAEDPLKIAGFEEALLALTKEFTSGIEALADARVDALHKALDAMQASIDSLDRGRNAEVPPAMLEALKNLVAARRELATLITNAKGMMASAMRGFDRKQAQKIRKPKSKDEEAEEVAERLEALAKEEEFVYATLSQGDNPDPSNKGESPEPKDADKKAAQLKNDEKAEDGPKAKGGQGQAKREGQGEDGNGGEGEPKKLDRREVAEKQENIADEIRDLEEKLKRIEAASDLAKARMARAAEKVEKVSGDLARGNAKEATEDAKLGAGMLHELARQVKGEIARESADELAMARDLAQELAKLEAEFAERNDLPPTSKGDGEGDKGKGPKPGSGTPTEAEQLDRMAEMARTLQEWLKQVDKKGEGKAADAVGEILDKGVVAEIVERAERMGEVRVGGKREELRVEAKELASKLEVLATALEILHRGVVAPELAALVEFDRRIAELTARLASLDTEADVAAWRRDVAALIRDLEKARIEGAAELADALRAAGDWRQGVASRGHVVPETVTIALRTLSTQVKDRVQELILKDLASSRDESTPPAFRELVDRYYEVISKGVRKK